MTDITIEGYEIGPAVGSGGFGTVYSAYQPSLARTVAVKVHLGRLSTASQQRFERECQAVGALGTHPHVVSVHGSGITTSGSPWLAMELLGGGTLEDRSPLPWDDVATIGVKLCGALETAHRSGVIHRDVKPRNILFSDFSEPALVDFGIASVDGGYETESSLITASLAHAAPEVINGQKATNQSDVYSLASSLVAALTGSGPFVRSEDESLVPLIGRILTEPPPDLRATGVPDEMATVLERGLAKAPTERYASALAFGNALSDVLDQLGRRPTAPIVGSPLPPTATVAAVGNAAAFEVTSHSRPNRIPMIVGAGLVAVVALIVAIVVTRTGTDEVLVPATTSTVLTTTTQPPIVAGEPVVFAQQLLTNGAVADRIWRLGEGARSLDSTSTVTNPTAQRVESFEIASIPKAIAPDVSNVSFQPPPDLIIEPDPVVSWRVSLDPGQTTQFTWSVPVAAPPTAEQLSEWRDQVVAEESVARLAQEVDFCKLFPCSPVAAPEAPTATSTPLTGIQSSTTRRTTPPSSSQMTITTRPVTSTTLPRVATTQAADRPAAPRSVVSSLGGAVEECTEPGTIDVRVTWQAPSSDGGSGITGYRIVARRQARSDDAALIDNWSAERTTNANTFETTFTVPSSPARAYVGYTVSAFNTAGESTGAVASVRVPNMIGNCSWTLYSVWRRVGTLWSNPGDFANPPAGQGGRVRLQAKNESDPPIAAGTNLYFEAWAE